MAKTKLSVEQRAVVVSRYVAGEEAAPLAAEFGVSIPAVQHLVESRGHLYRRKFKRWGIDKSSELSACYRSGMNLVELGIKYNRSPGTIHDILKTRGEVLRSASEAKRKYAFDEKAFDVLTDDVCYWIGFLLADGCIGRNNCGTLTVSLSLSIVDIGHVEKFRSFLNAGNPVTIEQRNRNSAGSYPGSKPVARLSIVSNRLGEALVSYGVVPRKSGIETVDPRLQYNRHFWRGMVDGDGWIILPPKTGFIGLTGSMSVCESFRNFALQYTLSKASIHPNKSIWKFSVSSADATAMAEKLYGDCGTFLTRKRDKAQWLIDNYRPVRQNDWSHLTVDFLADSYAKNGNWSAVERDLGMPKGSVKSVRQRLGFEDARNGKMVSNG